MTWKDLSRCSASYSGAVKSPVSIYKLQIQLTNKKNAGNTTLRRDQIHHNVENFTAKCNLN